MGIDGLVGNVEQNEIQEAADAKTESKVDWNKVKDVAAMGIVALGLGFDSGTQAVENPIGHKRYEEVMELPSDGLDLLAGLPEDDKHHPFRLAMEGIVKDLEKGEEIKERIIMVDRSEIAGASAPPPDTPESPDMSLESIEGTGEFKDTWLADANVLFEE